MSEASQNTTPLFLDVVEWYPYLSIAAPSDDYERARAVDVPEELYARLTAAENEVYEAKAAILRHVHAARQLPADVAEHFDYMIEESPDA